MGLVFKWVSPDGETFNLTAGDKGVRLDVGQQGLTLPTVEHIRDGVDRLIAVRKRPIEPTLRVIIGYGLKGTAWRQVHERWWKANSFYRDGVLRVEDGSRVATLKCRLRSSPETEWVHSPLTGLDGPISEVWPLTSEQLDWYGALHWVQYRSGSGTSQGPWSNVNGQPSLGGAMGVMYPVYYVSGNASGSTFGIANRVGNLNLLKGVPSGQVLRVDTDPVHRSCRLVGANNFSQVYKESAWDYLGGSILFDQPDRLRLDVSGYKAGFVRVEVQERLPGPF